MPIQDRITTVAVGKQVAKGTYLATPTHGFGINSGSVASLEISDEDMPTTWSSRLLEHHDRGEMQPGANYDVPAMPGMIGLLLNAALGSDTVTGSSAPYTHTFKAATTLPYYTLYARRDAEYYRVGDSRLSELELSWEGTKALMAKATWLGCEYSFLASAYTAATTNERPQSGVFKGAGGTFTVDGAAAVIKSGSVKISNSVEGVFGSASPLPTDVFLAMQRIDFSLTIVPENLQLFRQVVTGTTSGTSVQATPEYGAAVCKFILDANTDLELNAARLKFMTSQPDVNAEGGAAEITLEGSVANTTSGDPFTAILRNTAAAAY